MNVNIGIGVRGIFSATVKHNDGSEDNYGGMGNLIVQQGLDAIGGLMPSGYSGTWSAQSAKCVVGTGNTPPSLSDVSLESPLSISPSGSARITAVVSVAPPYAQSESVVYTFALGAVVGNIAEVGLCFYGKSGGDSANNLVFNRALILVDGAPGVIPVLITDQLIVTWTGIVSMAGDISGSQTITIDGTPQAIAYSARPFGFPTQPFYGIFVFPLAFSGDTGPYYRRIGQANTALTDFVSVTSDVGVYPYPTAATGVSTAPYVQGSNTLNFTATYPTGNTRSPSIMYGIEMFFIPLQIKYTSAWNRNNLQTMQYNFTFSWANV